MPTFYGWVILMRDRFAAFLRGIGRLLVLLSPCVYFALEYIGATYTPRNRFMQSLSVWLLVFWCCIAIFFGVRMLLLRQKAAKSSKKKGSP